MPMARDPHVNDSLQGSTRTTPSSPNAGTRRGSLVNQPNVNNNSNFNAYRDTFQLLNPPLTPIASSASSLYAAPSYLNRRFSRAETTTCSSSSSLYESNTFAQPQEDDHDQQHDQQQHYHQQQHINNNEDNFSHTSSFLKSYDISSDEDSSSDGDDVVSRNGISSQKAPSVQFAMRGKGLFKKNWDISASSGQSSPSPSPAGTLGGPGPPTSMPSSSQNFDETTPIFKRIVSRNSLKPQLKSFRRVSNELYQESLPFENEINHENLILLNLKEEEDILNHHAVKRQVTEERASREREKDRERESTQGSGLGSKVEIIRRANENWSLKKNKQLSSNSNGGKVIGDRALGFPLSIKPQALTPLTPLTPQQQQPQQLRPASPTNSNTSLNTNYSQNTQLSTSTNQQQHQPQQQQHQYQPQPQLSSLLKKRTFESEESVHHIDHFKRRAVSGSPGASNSSNNTNTNTTATTTTTAAASGDLTPTTAGATAGISFHKRNTNVKLISRTSTDLERMSLG